MLDQYYIVEKLRNCELPADTQDLVITIIDGIMALAARAANSNSDSNSLGGTNYLSWLRICPLVFYRFQPALQELP